MTTPSKEAREAAARIWHDGPLDEQEIAAELHRFQLEERERCAKVAEKPRLYTDPSVRNSIATTIRQQGEVKP